MKFKRIISLLLCALLMVSVVPNSVRAAEIPAYKGNSYLKIGNQLFYKTGKRSSTKLVTRNVNKKTVKTLDSIPVSNPFIVRRNYVYYETEKGINRVRDDGKKKTQLVGRKAQIIGFSGSYMYYRYSKGNYYYIAKMTVNGQDNKVLVKKPWILDAVLAFDRVYFVSYDEEDRDGAGFTSDKCDLSYVSLNGTGMKRIITDKLFANLTVNVENNGSSDKDLFADKNGVYFKYWENYRTGRAVIHHLTSEDELKVVRDIDGKEFYSLDSVTVHGIQNGKLYYHIQERLYSYSPTNGKETVVMDLSKTKWPKVNMTHWAGSDIFLKGNRIFVANDDWNRTYYFNLDGSNLKYYNTYTWAKTADVIGNTLYYQYKTFKSIKL